MGMNVRRELKPTVVPSTMGNRTEAAGFAKTSYGIAVRWGRYVVILDSWITYIVYSQKTDTRVCMLLERKFSQPSLYLKLSLCPCNDVGPSILKIDVEPLDTEVWIDTLVVATLFFPCIS